MAQNKFPFWERRARALRRCSALVWLATRRSERLASNPALRPQNGKLFPAMAWLR